MTRQRGDASLLRRLNSAAILRVLRESGPSTVSELAGAARVSRPTAEAIVDELVAGGWAEECGDEPADRRRGRPARRFTFRAAAGHVAGVGIGSSWLRAMVSDLDGTVVYPQASVGVAVSTGEPTTAGELLRRADTAMYAAKSEGKDTVTVFRPRLDVAQRGRLQLRADLQAALDRDEFELHYQPTVDLVTGTLTGVEALLRWRHPRRGLVAPSAFLPLAEDSGLIVPVGRWVLAEACRQAAVWQRQHPERVTTVSVNLSGRQVAVPEVVDHVRDALADSGLEPGRLVLEITESVLLEQTPALAERLAELKALGVRLAVDDFGTGYSSLAYLQRLPVDVLKIDKTFVEALGDGVEQEALAETIVTLARMMRLQAVAEGVERQEQASVLRDLGCDLAQGHLFAAPQQAAAIGDLLGAADGVGPADGVGLSA